eukprot:scaffold5672_cov193-Isochrysis_galbana.AAC.1
MPRVAHEGGGQGAGTVGCSRRRWPAALPMGLWAGRLRWRRAWQLRLRRSGEREGAECGLDDWLGGFGPVLQPSGQRQQTVCNRVQSVCTHREDCPQSSACVSRACHHPPAQRQSASPPPKNMSSSSSSSLRPSSSTCATYSSRSLRLFLLGGPSSILCGTSCRIRGFLHLLSVIRCG